MKKVPIHFITSIKMLLITYQYPLGNGITGKIYQPEHAKMIVTINQLHFLNACEKMVQLGNSFLHLNYHKIN